MSRHLVPFVLLVSCAPSPRDVSLRKLCIANASPGDVSAIAPGRSLRIGLESGGCPPDCGETIQEQTCALEREGNTFRVRGRLVIQGSCGGHTPLPVCAFRGVDCGETGPLDAGDYVVTDGTRRVAFTVPVLTPPPAEVLFQRCDERP